MRFSVLDSWRGISALLVALFHLNAYGHFYFIPLVRSSYLFVDFFFVLSGFVISYTYLSRLNAGRDLKPFVIRRFGRVWPLHIFMLLLFVAFPFSEWLFCDLTKVCGAQWPFQPEDGRTALANIFLLHAMGVDDSLSWNWPSWSISAEFYAYLLFAVVCIIARPVRISLALLIACASAIVVLVLSPRYINTTYELGYFRCLFGFFSGVVVFRLYEANDRIVRRLPTVLEIAAVLGVGAFLTLVGTAAGTMLAPLVFGCCVYVFAHEAGAVSRLLRSKPLLTMGAWSYSIYMVHAFILIVLLRGVRGIERLYGIPIRLEMGYSTKLYYFHSRYAMDIAAVVYLMVVVAVAAVTYRLVEDPARRWFNGVAKKLEMRKP